MPVGPSYVLPGIVNSASGFAAVASFVDTAYRAGARHSLDPLLILAVGWAYTQICRIYQNGGGVYTAGRRRARVLGVIGALAVGGGIAAAAGGGKKKGSSGDFVTPLRPHAELTKEIVAQRGELHEVTECLAGQGA